MSRLVELKPYMNSDSNVCSKVKKGVKAFAGGLSGAIMDTFIVPGAAIYYDVKCAYDNFKHLEKDNNWNEIEILGHITSLPFLLLSPPVGFIYGAITGAEKAIQEKEGILSFIKNMYHEGVEAGQVII